MNGIKITEKQFFQNYMFMGKGTYMLMPGKKIKSSRTQSSSATQTRVKAVKAATNCLH
jgi:hypothetical protein